MRRCATVIGLVLACVSLRPCTAFAQASITGVVHDISGAVLPGVTVEASSPALIEKVRGVVTDGAGRYRIEELRPGAYTVTFTLTGFETVKREGIELAGSFTATVNVDLKVGAVEETVVVTGESPIVDTHSSRREQEINSDVLRAIPTAGSAANIVGLVPGLTINGTQDVGGLNGAGMSTFSMHGGPATEGRLQIDGISVGASLGGSGVSGYVADVVNSREVSITSSGALGEVEVGGPVVNVVPRTGANTSLNFHGQPFA